MGRFDALIAGISGTTLVGFVGLVGYAVLAAFGVVTVGAAGGADPVGVGAYAPDASSSAGSTTGEQFERHSATTTDGSVSFLDLGANTALSDDGSVSIAPIWVFIEGFDDSGAPLMIPDHPSILDVVVGDDGYSDLWDVQFVLTSDEVNSREIRSLAELQASGLEIVPAHMLVNCPLVDGDATTSEGHPVRSGWYRGEQVHYFDLGVSAAVPGAIYEFVLADDPALGGYSAPEPLDVPPLVVPPPTDGPAAQFFRLYQVEVPDASVAEGIGSAAEVEAGGFWIRSTG